MDKETIVCEALLDTLTGLTITVSEFKILLALRIHGELKRSHLMAMAGFNSHNQELLNTLVAKCLIDKVKFKANSFGGTMHYTHQTKHTHYKYSINPNGLIALKKAIRPTYK